ncbi:MAG: hypothetical protein AAFU68_02925 [Pseudomonadota bacterium]
MSNKVAVNPMNRGGSLVPQGFDEMWRLAQVLAASSLVPYDYQNKPENVFLAVDMGLSLGLAPTQAIQRIAVINGRVAVWGSAIPAIIRSKGYQLVEMVEGDGDKAVATAEVRDPQGNIVSTASFSVDDAKQAGLWGKKTRKGEPTPWITYPKRMLMHRARGYAAQDSGLLVGIITAEEAIDTPAEIKDITPEPPQIPQGAQLAGDAIEDAAEAPEVPADVVEEIREKEASYNEMAELTDEAERCTKTTDMFAGAK